MHQFRANLCGCVTAFLFFSNYFADVSDIFYFFFCFGGGEREEELEAKRGDFLLGNRGGGVSEEGRRGGAHRG